MEGYQGRKHLKLSVEVNIIAFAINFSSKQPNDVQKYYRRVMQIKGRASWFVMSRLFPLSPGLHWELWSIISDKQL